MTTCNECGRFVIPIEDGQAPDVCNECDLLGRLSAAALACGLAEQLGCRDLLLDARDTVERLRSEWDEEVERNHAFSGAVQDALAPVANWYLDPPDGGSVGEAEMVTRLIADLRSREAAVAELEAQLHATDVARLEALAEIERLTRAFAVSEQARDDAAAFYGVEIERLQARERELEAALTELHDAACRIWNGIISERDEDFDEDDILKCLARPSDMAKAALAAVSAETGRDEP